MSNITITGTPLGNQLTTLMNAEDIQPGDAPSYQTCKTILAYHPLGQKMAGGPIKMAQSQKRRISIPVKSGSDKLVERLQEAFTSEWLAIGADKHIANTATLSRAYGVATCALLTEGVDPALAIEFAKLANAEIAINVYDPLNTSGSLVGNQQPNDLNFQKVDGVRVQAQQYHRSRTVVLMNEEPIYIEWSHSAFGYVGRSVYQRAFYMLKSYLQTLVTDDMISLKAGVLIASLKQAGSAVDQIMASVAGQKRAIVNEAQTGNTISVGIDEKIESLNLQNLDGAFGMARKNILENIATAADMPAVILNQETFAEGFGEGTEDAKKVAAYITGIREWLQPLYAFFDKLVMYRAWNKEFYKILQRDFPDRYKGVPYNTAFYDWRNSFAAEWPNLIEEPDSEKVQVDDVKLKAMIAIVEVLMPALDPENKSAVVEWLMDNVNDMKMLFTSPLVLDIDALKEYVPPDPMAAGEEGGMKEPAPPKPFAAQDHALRLRNALDASDKAVARLPDRSSRNMRRLADVG